MMLRLSKWAAVAAVAGVLTAAVGAQAQTAAQSEAKAVVLKADAALKNFRNDSAYAAGVREALSLGRAVLIVPDYIRGGIGIGGAAGTGVLVQKTEGADGWSAPRFFDVRAANIGPQLGFQKGDLLIAIGNTETLRAILAGEFTLAADATVQAGNVTEGMQASTTTSFRNTGVAVFMRGEGAYAGATVGGARISVNSALDRAQLAPADADALRSTLMLVTGAPTGTR
jgi:lipid-binding SYLF domain-containing protein